VTAGATYLKHAPVLLQFSDVFAPWNEAGLALISTQLAWPQKSTLCATGLNAYRSVDPREFTQELQSLLARRRPSLAPGGAATRALHQKAPHAVSPVRICPCALSTHAHA
jgi:hypothetical protein